MTKESATFLVAAEGVPLALDQLEKMLRDLASEGERGGVDVEVTRVEEKADRGGFSNDHE